MQWQPLFSVPAYAHQAGINASGVYTIPPDTEWLRVSVLLDQQTAAEGDAGAVHYEFSIDEGQTWVSGCYYEWRFTTQLDKFGAINYAPAFVHSLPAEYKGALLRGTLEVIAAMTVGIAVDCGRSA